MLELNSSESLEEIKYLGKLLEENVKPALAGDGQARLILDCIVFSSLIFLMSSKFKKAVSAQDISKCSFKFLKAASSWTSFYKTRLLRYSVYSLKLIRPSEKLLTFSARGRLWGTIVLYMLRFIEQYGFIEVLPPGEKFDLKDVLQDEGIRMTELTYHQLAGKILSLMPQSCIIKIRELKKRFRAEGLSHAALVMGVRYGLDHGWFGIDEPSYALYLLRDD
ncbi:MAG: hypothetical protein LBP22_08735 [Deltaproteobacteria bacterium]|nr:hypothetical protein [Deltaproteobacteria bacterium]